MINFEKLMGYRIDLNDTLLVAIIIMIIIIIALITQAISLSATKKREKESNEVLEDGINANTSLKKWLEEEREKSLQFKNEVDKFATKLVNKNREINRYKQKLKEKELEKQSKAVVKNKRSS